MGIKHWREAATVILTAQSRKKPSNNFKILTLKRSERNDFMPGGYVFPGGNIHPSDSNIKWLDHFQKFKFDNLNKIFMVNGEVPELFKDEDNEVPKAVSLRIAAIRETFEESGILLCKDVNVTNETQNFTGYKYFPDLECWRSKVQKDGFEFFNLCQNFNCYPDIKGLHLWSDWLTPRTELGKRFDTAFFLASIDDIPKGDADETEVENLSWRTANDLLKASEAKEIWLPPPQVYEIARILRFQKIEDLYSFASKISAQGCERWMPERVNTKNGIVTLLPGDEAYKVDDYSTTDKVINVNQTNEEYRSKLSVLHRMEHVNKFDTKIIIKNYFPKHGHVVPIS